jgi:hypothetical protein
MTQVNTLPTAHGYVDWLVPGQVLYERLVGDITTPLLSEIDTLAQKYLAEATPRLAVLIDVSGITNLPTMREMPRLNGLRAMKGRWIITVDETARTSHHIHCVTWNVLGTLYQFHSRPFVAVALALDAIQALHRQMPDLAPLYEALLDRFATHQAAGDRTHFVG